jgi:ATP-dependent Clp protease ATP-binding subunit ClpA
LATILEHHLDELQNHITARLGDRAFRLEIPVRTRRFLLKTGASQEYGARELKRTLQRHLVQPLARVVSSGCIMPGDVVRADMNASRSKIVIHNADDTAALELAS